ncbi:MAG: hypothetical protein ACOCVC_07260, partial [Spirochaeta sp.]
DDIVNQAIELDPLSSNISESTALLDSGGFDASRLSAPWPGRYTLSYPEGAFQEDIVVLLQSSNGTVVASSSSGGELAWTFGGPNIGGSLQDYYLSFYNAGEMNEVSVGLTDFSLAYEPGPEVGISGAFTANYLQPSIDSWESVVLTTDVQGENVVGEGTISDGTWSGRLDTGDYTHLYATASGYSPQYGLISYRSSDPVAGEFLASTGAPVQLDLTVGYYWDVVEIVEVNLSLNIALDSSSSILTQQPIGTGYLDGMLLTEVDPNDPEQYSIGYVYPGQGNGDSLSGSSTVNIHERDLEGGTQVRLLLLEYNYDAYEIKQWLSPWITLTFVEQDGVFTSELELELNDDWEIVEFDNITIPS